MPARIDPDERQETHLKGEEHLYGSTEWLFRLPRRCRTALLHAEHSYHTIAREKVFVRQGERLDDVLIVASGAVARTLTTDVGKRQIVSLHFPGEILNYESFLDRGVDGNLQALTETTLARVDLAGFRRVLVSNVALLAELCNEALKQWGEARQWLLNVRRLSSSARVAFLLCEIAKKSLAHEGEAFELKLSQPQIADCAGLTSVHVNRVLGKLEEVALIKREGRFVTFEDIPSLRTLASH